MHRIPQLGTRENPASDRRHDPRLASRTYGSPISERKAERVELATGAFVQPALAVRNQSEHAAENTAATGEKSGDDKQLLTVPEVATRLHVNRAWVYAHADRLGAYRLGKYLRFSWKRVLEELEQ